jgi:hypothetical protein
MIPLSPNSFGPSKLEVVVNLVNLFLVPVVRLALEILGISP